MKTKEQIFKTKVLEQVKQLTNKGLHQQASSLFNYHFNLKTKSN
jgi:elongation factor P hydroxylase